MLIVVKAREGLTCIIKLKETTGHTCSNIPMNICCTIVKDKHDEVCKPVENTVFKKGPPRMIPKMFFD